MIDIITGHRSFRRMALTTAMHRLRHLVFKEVLNWEVSSLNGLEIDQFDTESAVYLLAYDEDENLAGTLRLLPTTGPYMLKNVFPQLLDGRPAPCAPQIWEISRLAVHLKDGNWENGTGLNTPQAITRDLFMGVGEFCIARGIKEAFAVYDVRLARLLPRIGCKPFWQSRPQRIGKTLALAGAVETSPAVLAQIQASGNYTNSVIRLAPWLTPLPTGSTQYPPASYSWAA